MDLIIIISYGIFIPCYHVNQIALTIAIPDINRHFEELNANWTKSHPKLKHIQIDWSGTESDPTYYIHSTKLETRNNEHILITNKIQKPQTKTDQAIQQYCRYYSLPYQQPRWYATANYY